MFSCQKVADAPLDETSYNAKIDKEEDSYRNKKITAIALGCIAVFLAGFGLIWMGIGTMPSTMSFGYGVFPCLAGSQILLLAGGVFAGALLFTGLTVYHRIRFGDPDHKRQVLQRQSSMV